MFNRCQQRNRHLYTRTYARTRTHVHIGLKGTISTQRRKHKKLLKTNVYKSTTYAGLQNFSLKKYCIFGNLLYLCSVRMRYGTSQDSKAVFEILDNVI